MTMIIDDTELKYGIISTQCTFCKNQLHPHYTCAKFGEIPMKYWRDQEKCPHKNTLTPEEWRKERENKQPS